MDARCLECGHLAGQHNLGGGDLGCRVRKLAGWSTEKAQFLRSEPCGCPGYRGINPAADTCDHEFLKEGGCVHCGASRVQH